MKEACKVTYLCSVLFIKHASETCKDEIHPEHNPVFFLLFPFTESLCGKLLKAIQHKLISSYEFKMANK